MTALQAASLEETDQETKREEPLSPVRFTPQDDHERKNDRADPTSPLYRIASSISWRNMNLYIELMEDGNEGKAMIQSPLMHRSQSCSNIQCKTINQSPFERKSQKSRKFSIDHKQQIDPPPRRLTMAGSMVKKVTSMRNIWSKPEKPPTGIPNVIYFKSHIHRDASAPPKTEKKMVEASSPTSVLSERPKLPRRNSSSRHQPAPIPPISPSQRQRPRLPRQSSSTRKLTNLLEL
jgi:hypothetical protein